MNNKGIQDWAALYAEFKKSGMTVAEFARWKGIALTTSYSMISKYRKREASGKWYKHNRKIKSINNLPKYFACAEDTAPERKGSQRPP